MAYGSEEFNALGGLKRSQITGDDDYLRQLNNITSQTVDSINRSGDAMARANQNKWDAINQGISNGFDTYRDVTKENRQQARQDSQDKIASEERDRAHAQQDITNQREGEKFGLEKEEMGLRNKEYGLKNEEYQAKVSDNNRDSGKVDAQGNPLTIAQYERQLGTKTSEGALATNESNLATQAIQQKMYTQTLQEAKEGSAIAHAKAALWQPLAAGDEAGAAKAHSDLLNQGFTPYEADSAVRDVKAAQAASTDAKRATFWVGPQFAPVKADLQAFDKRAEGIKLVSDLKSQYDASSGKFYGEGKEGEDAKAKFAQIMREYFGDDKAAQELQERWTKGNASDNMQRYIDMQKGMLNNQYMAKKPELAQFVKQEPYVGQMMTSIEQGLKYQPTLLPNATAPTRPIFSVMPAATAPQANQQFMQQAAAGGPPPQGPNAAQPQMNGQAIQVGMPVGPGQATQGQPPMQPQMPPQEHPMYKFRKK